MFLLHNVLEAYEPVDVGWICLIPPLLTMIIALSSKEVVISLLIGVIVATLIYVIKSRRPFVQIIEVFFSILTSRTAVNMEICLFTFMMGGLVKLMERSGGTAAFCRWFGRLVKSRKITQLVAIILSFFLFLDDYFNIITSSAIMYAVFDQNRVSKPKAAYVVHTMASNLCILIPITSWAAVVIAQIEECGIKDSFSMYSRSLLLNSYPVCSVLGVLLSSLTGVEIGGMKEYEKEAQSPATLEEDLLPEETESKGRLVDLLLPSATLILSTVLFIVYLGGGFEGHKSLQQVFTDSDTATALMFGSFMAILVSFLLYIPRRLMTFRDFVEALKEGMKVMIDTLLILVLAWTVGGIDSTLLRTGEYLGNLISRCHLPLWIIPSVIFLVGALLTFSLGTTWAGFSVLIPIVVSICTKTDRALLVPCISACLSGSVFGDNISPICDNTILVGTCLHCDFIVHVKTESVYAITMAVLSFIGYIIVGITGGNILLSVGIPVVMEIVLFIIVSVIAKLHINKFGFLSRSVTPKEDLVFQVQDV